jgi:small subunit ribosomal protein S1
MGSNQKYNASADGGAPASDAWWQSVLTEVENLYSQDSETTSNKAPTPLAASEKPAQEMVDWEKAQSLYQQDQVIDLVVTGHNRGGLLVQGQGILGFVPLSHLVKLTRGCADREENPALEAYTGQRLRLKIIECERERGRVVFSERAALSDPGRRNELLESLREGDCLLGRITTITNFGAFVDLGGIEGLIHISELSWGRVCHPHDVVEQDQELEVSVLQIDRERSRVALSLKRLQPNPWDNAHVRYSRGQVTNAVITSVVSFGAFARLDDGLDGLIHISELRNDGQPAKDMKDLLKEGQQVQVCILNIDPQRQRLGLGLHASY